jgi:hypothetical protein
MARSGNVLLSGAKAGVSPDPGYTPSPFPPDRRSDLPPNRAGQHGPEREPPVTAGKARRRRACVGAA